MPLLEILQSDTVVGGLIVVAVPSAVIGIWKFGTKLFGKLDESLDKLDGASNTLTAQNLILAQHGQAIEDIQKQMRTNGGSSLRDAVLKIEAIAVTAVAQNDALIEDREIAAYRSDPEGRCLAVSKRWCQMAGMTREEAMGYGGFGWNNAVREDDRARIHREWENSIKKGIPFVGEFHFINGMLCKTRAEPVRQGDKVIAWLGTTEPKHEAIIREQDAIDRDIRNMGDS